MENNFRSILLSILVPIFAPTIVVLAGIWAAASWTAGQDNKMAIFGQRLLDMEKVASSDRAQDSRISHLELRLNWLDEEKKTERAEARQLNKEIRDALEKLNNAVTRLEASDSRNRR